MKAQPPAPTLVAMAAVMPPALQFTGRNRRPPRDPVNACLSLGYTLLHAQAVQACAVAGLDPLLGFYHRPAFGRESLASDLIEALRPAVDLWVWELVRSRTLLEDHFSHARPRCLPAGQSRARHLLCPVGRTLQTLGTLAAQPNPTAGAPTAQRRRTLDGPL
jgi:CRISPR-associated endonuclease Cas1